ncbi:TPA: type IV secretory system conjugative DNA transfer family protein [Enterococcus faecalis]|nr:type IV secretory system conjugative DNA transfer family protein [Enterococcus faecium]HAP4448784.1 type IV secretory system conjugative DNA transfer family protein [Enterococcus faecalis]SAM67070.1 TraG/TraD family protein [Enterococcus faecium]HAP4458508.1 type IV secretory system conjugative DNA transfer family protein [Enterococcus faecalis]HAP4461565.1 type IV secretory system conjugative DNA transfer family protein [Enterococcus faecalis]
MKPDVKKLLILNLPYLIFVYLFAKCGEAYRLAAGADLSGKLLHFADGFAAAFANPLPSLHLFDLCIGIAGAVIVRLVVYCKSKNVKKYRKGMEYGSARWGTAKDIAPYIDPKFENNILLTQTERLTMTGRPKDPKTARNKNVLVIGGSGSGKTRFFVKPNLMQCFPTTDYPTSFVVTDPKGTLVLETGRMFQQAGYRIKILNTINFSKSMKYNPFVYIHSEKDVLKLVNTLISNTKGEGEKSAEEMNFSTLLEMINASEAREDDPEFQSPVDLMFERLEQKDPDHFAVRQYKKFLLSAGKTRSSILISCGARLAPFDIREVRELMEDDEMELDTIGDEKTVLYLIMSDTDTTFNFILAMLQSQLINLLCDRADDVYGGRLPVHVRLILDEFANIGQIPNFDKLIATIRSREISASIILQSQSQLKAIYKDAAEIISDNCDSVLFLSGRGKNAKEISDALGKETIDSFNTSENRGSQTSHGLNYQKLGKELMSQDEIAVMDGGKCILQLRGVRPFLSEKFDITKHPRYKYLADADKKNTFDVDRFLTITRRKRQQVVTQDEVFDLYEIDLSDEDAAAE